MYLQFPGSNTRKSFEFGRDFTELFTKVDFRITFGYCYPEIEKSPGNNTWTFLTTKYRNPEIDKSPGNDTPGDFLIRWVLLPRDCFEKT